MSEAIPIGLVEVARIPAGALKQEVLLLQHEATGLRIALCKLPGPLCQMDVVVPTECTNNKGLPHCLEHLVFMGSQQYPQRGYLDKLANLCLAQGTNAWTDKDHTAYNAVTAGHLGLLTLIPVFLDHVMHPTLTEAQFASEIYHVDGEGKQNGVVFCEMQGRESSEDDMLDLAMHRLSYPNTGYQYECGGLTPDIATLDNGLVKEYHSRFYRPENAFLLVHGQVPLNDLAAAINSWSTSREGQMELAPSGLPKLMRPWAEVPPPLAASRSQVVEFPAEDESVAAKAILNPLVRPHIGDSFTCIALEVLFRFLQEGAASPIAQRFVECADPWSSGVEFDVELRLRTCISLSFSGVPNADGAKGDDEEEGGEGDDEDGDGEDDESGSEEDEDEDDEGSKEGGESRDDEGSKEGGESRDDQLNPGVVKDELIKLLREEVAEAGLLKAADLRDAVKRHRLKLLEECEEEPADALHNYLLPELLFRDQIDSLGCGFSSRLDQEKALAELETKDESFWKKLLEVWILDAPVAEVIMVPSKRLAKERSDAEAAATAKRREEMGDAGLKAAKEAVEAASKVSAPKPLPDSFLIPPLPPSSAISRLPMSSSLLRMPRTCTPVQVVRLATNFHHLSICLDAGQLPARLRPYLVMMREMMLSSPVVLDDGSRIDYKDVVKQVQKDTVTAGCSLGLTGSSVSGCLGGVFVFSGVSLPGRDGFTKLCGWVQKALYKVEFDEARVETCILNMYKDMTSALRDGSTICSTLTNTLTCKQLKGPQGEGEGCGDNDVAVCLFKQKPFLGGLKAGLKTGKGAKEAVECLEQLRTILASRGPPVMIQIGAPDGSAEESEGLAGELTGLLDAGMAQMRGKTKATPKGRASKRRRADGEGGRGQNDEAKDARVTGGVRRWGVKEQCVVTPVDGIESAYVEQVVPCGVHRRDADYMPIYFLSELLSRSEGPLWVGIRGKGYAYHASLELGVLTGQLYFSLGECGAPAKAIEVFQEIIRDVPAMLSSAEAERAVAETRAAIMYSLHSRRSTASGVMHQAIKSYFSGAESPGADLDLEIERLSAVSVDDLLRVWKTYFEAFLSPGVRCTSVACVGKKGKEIAEDLSKCLGVKADVKTVDDLLMKA